MLPPQTGVEHGPTSHLRDTHVDSQEGIVLRRVVGEEEAHLLQLDQFPHSAVPNSRVREQLKRFTHDLLAPVLIEVITFFCKRLPCCIARVPPLPILLH